VPFAEEAEDVTEQNEAEEYPKPGFEAPPLALEIEVLADRNLIIHARNGLLDLG
jgi:hypothetical protein